MQNFINTANLWSLFNICFWPGTKGLPLSVSVVFLSVILQLIPVVSLCAQQKPISVYIVDPTGSSPILPDTYLGNPDNDKPINITCSRNESALGSFVLRANKDIKANIVITMSDLVSREGKLDHDRIDIKIVKHWYQERGAWSAQYVVKNKKGPVLIPELLLHDESLIKIDEINKKNFLKVATEEGTRFIDISVADKKEVKRIIHSTSEINVRDATSLKPFTLPKNRNKQFVIICFIPEEAAPGLYYGDIRLTWGSRRQTIKLKLRILPFVLPASKIVYSMYYRGYLDFAEGSVSSEKKNLAQITAELSDLRDHGIRNPTVYQKLNHLEELRALLDLRSRLNILNSPLYYLGFSTGTPQTPSAIENLKIKINKLRAVAREKAIDEIYVYGQDEAQGETLLLQRAAWKAARDLGVKIMAAGSKGAIDAVGDLLDLLVLHGKLDVNEALKAHASNTLIFSYGNPQTGPENPDLFRRNYGLQVWAAGYDGVMIYAYQHSFGSIWNDFDHEKYRDHVLAYPTANGVISTLAWEGLRQGINDVRYIEMLEEVMKKPSLKEMRLEEGRTLLENIKDNAFRHPDLPETRKQVIKEILKLRIPDPFNLHFTN